MKDTEKEAIVAMGNDAADIHTQVRGLEFIYEFLLDETSNENGSSHGSVLLS